MECNRIYYNLGRNQKDSREGEASGHSADRNQVLFEPFLPEYKLYHSCEKGKDKQQSRSGSGGVIVAVQESFTTQNSVETINHDHPAAKAHCKAVKIHPPGSDCIIIWGLYLPSDNMQKREQLYELITRDMRSEQEKAVQAGLTLPFNIVAGDMNAALFPGDIQHAIIDKVPGLHTCIAFADYRPR